MRKNSFAAILPASSHRSGVAETDTSPSSTITKAKRVLLAALAAALFLPLAVAAILVPDARGHGTHEQLGLPPCSFRVLFGRPCPTCGMTTAWAHLLRGEVGDALRANVGGSVLALLALGGAPWLAGCAAWGRWLWYTPRDTSAAYLAVAIALVTLADWAVRLLMP